MSAAPPNAPSHSSFTPFWRCLVAFVVLLTVIGGGAGTLGAQKAGATSSQASSSRTKAVLTYSDVDLATVRIIMVKGVQMERVILGDSRVSAVAMPEIGHGSGVAIRADGLVLTAHHVVEGAGALAVKVPGQRKSHPAQVVYEDKDLDFALVKTSAVFDKYLPISAKPRSLRMREPVHALGYPVDIGLHYPISSPGIIAGLLNDGLIQLAMSLNPGNSGGPVIDAQNELVAIVVARGDPHQGVLGLGVAMPLEPIARALRDNSVLAKKGLSWTPQQSKLATMVACMAETGPVGILREVSRLLRQADGLSLAELHALAMDGDSADFQALAAAYLWDARLMLVEEAGGILGDGDPRRQRASDLLDGTVELCHAALRRDPEVSMRSAFVGFVAGRWPLAEKPDSKQYRASGQGKKAAPAAPAPRKGRAAPPRNRRRVRTSVEAESY